MAPSWGAEGEFLTPGHWQFGVSYRALHSFRDFRGSEEVPSPPEIYASTYLNTVDFGATYAVTDRLSFTFGVPFHVASRETYYEHDGVSLHAMQVRALGDLNVAGSVWLLDPAEHQGHNISLGLGVKMPTGDSGATDYSYRTTGKVLRPVDPAIQPGDGGWGLLFTGQAFTTVANGTVAFVQGTYLMNPRETNPTQSPFGDLPDFTGGDIGYTINSVPDQYFFRVGAAHAFWPAQGLLASLAVRIDGVPSHDLIGGSEGYRLPGYSVALEPGVSLSRGRDVVTFSAPIAVRRRASFSVADLRTGNPYGGLAALADFVVNVSYSRRF